MNLKDFIRNVPDFPKPGIDFKDITPLLKDPEALKFSVEKLKEFCSGKEIDLIVGIESRGFIIGSILAHELGVGFVPIRKAGKLPADKIEEEYGLEYGKDKIEIHRDSISPGQKVLLIDDLLATAGTCLAACSLVDKLGGNIIDCVFMVELEDLGGRKRLEDKGYSVSSLLTFKGT